MDKGTVIPLVVAAVLLIAATPYVRKQRKRAGVELEDSTLAVAQREIQIERDARLASEQRCAERMEEQDRRHASQLSEHKEQNAKELGELRGQVSVLTGKFADQIAERIVEHLKAAK